MSNLQLPTRDKVDENRNALADNLVFVKKSWKTIAISTLVGLGLAITFLSFAPSLYEATAHIRLAQISHSSSSNPFGVAIEDPSSLAARMRLPSNYSKRTVEVCGYQNIKNPIVSLATDLKLAPLRGSPNVVELKIRAKSPELAFDCAKEIFLQISALQREVSSPFIEEAKNKLAENDLRIDAIKKLIAKADRSDSVSVLYFSARDELAYLLVNREKMIDLINSVKTRGASLTSPIYVADEPVYPNKIISILMGSIMGLFLGILLAYLKCVYLSKDKQAIF